MTKEINQTIIPVWFIGADGALSGSNLGRFSASAAATLIGAGLTSGTLAQFSATTSAQLAGVISDETGTGALVFANSPTLVTPALGTPSSGNLANCTGYTAANVVGLGTLATQNGTFSGTSSGTNTGDNAVNSLYSGLVSNATHTGDATGATVLTLATVNSNVGSFGSATQSVSFTVNGKGLVTAASATTITPAIGSVTGLGTGVATALAVNVGTAGATVVNGGALGTPSSGTLTNCTGLPTAGLVDEAVTFVKMQNISGTHLVGRHAGGTGDIQEVSVGGGIEFQGSGIRRSALTGDVTASAGSDATTIANDAVTYAKIQNVSNASRLLGRGDSGSGDVQEITLGTNLSMSGTTLNASGGGGGEINLVFINMLI